MDISVDNLDVTLVEIQNDSSWIIEYAPAYAPVLTVIISGLILIYIAFRQIDIIRQQMYSSTVSPLREKWIHSLRKTLCNFLQTINRSKKLKRSIVDCEMEIREKEIVDSMSLNFSSVNTDRACQKLRQQIEDYERELRERTFDAGRDMLIIKTMLSNKGGEKLHSDIYKKITELIKVLRIKDEKVAEKRFNEIADEVVHLAEELFKKEWEKIKQESTYKKSRLFSFK